MENHMPLETSKRAWHIVRVVFFMLRKGLCKRKVMVDLNMMLKRGKMAGKAAIGNLISHHHGRQPSSSLCNNIPGPHEYEFSCSNTPAHSYSSRLHLPWKPRKSGGGGNRHFHNLLFGCTHVPEEDQILDCQAVVEMLEKNNHLDGPLMEMLSSPMLPGFGQTPMVRQLRITDSPFPLKNDEEDDYVDKAAEEFIANFYKQLRKQ